MNIKLLADTNDETALDAWTEINLLHDTRTVCVMLHEYITDETQPEFDRQRVLLRLHFGWWEEIAATGFDEEILYAIDPEAWGF